MSKEEKLRILVTDDHTLFRKGTMMLVNTFKEVGEVKDASNGKEAIEELSKNQYDILLLDLDMPVMDGWEASRKIISKFPDLKIIMISMHDSLEVISDLIEIGVHSYLLKDAHPEEMHRAIVSVINNDFYYNHLVSKALHTKMQKGGKTSGPSNNVSPREAEVLELICQELTMKEIGEKLFLSEQTIHTHRKNLMKKTKAKNAVGLVKFAFQNGIASF